MHVVIESRLVRRRTAFLEELGFNVLLIYEDSRLLNAAMELLISAAVKMPADNEMRCSI